MTYFKHFSAIFTVDWRKNYGGKANTRFFKKHISESVTTT